MLVEPWPGTFSGVLRGLRAQRSLHWGRRAHTLPAGAGRGAGRPLPAAVQGVLWQALQTQAEVSSGAGGQDDPPGAPVGPLRPSGWIRSGGPASPRVASWVWAVAGLVRSLLCRSPVCGSVPRVWRGALGRAWRAQAQDLEAEVRLSLSAARAPHALRPRRTS